MADINVNFSDATQVISKDGFGKVLILDTERDSDYKEYDISRSIIELQKNYDPQTEVFKIANIIASQDPRPNKVAVFGKGLKSSEDKVADLIGALNLLINEHNNWYRLLCTDLDEKTIGGLSSWCEANQKMFYTQFNTAEITVDLTERNKTVLGFKKNDERLDAGMTGLALTRIPGSFTFKFKNIKGLTADIIPDSELQAVKGKNMNAYIRKFDVQDLGTAQLDEGKVASGMYIDQVESRDWVKFRIENEIAKLLMTTEKIPYDNLGIQMVVSAVDVALNDAFKNKIILGNDDGVPQFTVKYNTLDKIHIEDRKARRITGIEFQYIEAGAIHEVGVTGSVVLNL
ncbi:DUF3383 family protein [Clostridium botulinum]|uniref:Phage protein n=2 Tax=Clostridium botulinum TaxID=1491 RepID=M1ZZ77_CLOBO|nr:DUF3383 family protein [Clostridium botulinum]EKN42968.1 hypothetical protein CFSAN001627_03585 [Clostridium botulinum CFSAN001627]AXG97743.1 DUF3383 family protein [Clostridium botulinum]MBY6773625.1 DUF3383 family protein [Clostridium botulinum]MBY6850340.1 DUF3383 family protein [Clostridium botulinum]MBY6857400.1 DUF3383 family protein [Clostridium botulinum]